jgi:lipoteichoic acid synthase
MPTHAPAQPSRLVERLWQYLVQTRDLSMLALVISAKSVLLCKLAGFGFGLPAGFAMTLGTSFLLVSPLALLSGAWRRRSVLWMNIILTALLVGDLTHALYFRDVLSLHSASAAGGLSTIHESITALLGPMQLMLMVDLVAMAAFSWIRRWRGWTKPEWVATPRAAAVFLALGIGFGCVSIQMHFAKKTQGVFLRVWSQRVFVRSAGIVAFHIHDTARFLGEHIFVQALDTEAQVAVDTHWAQQDAASADYTDPSLVGSARDANVIFLMVESLQDQAMDTAIDGRPVTPNLNALATESVRFTRFHHQTAQGRTADAEAVTLCGVHALSQGALLFRYPDFPQRCLPEILRDEAGYTTASYHAMRSTFWNRAAVAPNIGIDLMHDDRDYKGTGKIGLGLGDIPFLDQSADKITQLKEPFFAHVITLTTHHPYRMPKGQRKLKLGHLKGTYLGRYFNSIHYVDRAIGRFVDTLRHNGVLDRSVLVVYGDHDMGRLSGAGDVVHVMDADANAAFLPRVPIGASKLGDPNHPLTRMEWMRRVPLLIRFPGGEHSGSVAQPTGQIQIPATVLSLLGLPTTQRDFLGPSLFIEANAPAPVIAFRDGSGVQGDLTYLQGGAEGEGSCWNTTSKAARPPTDCGDLPAAIRTELMVSDTVLQHGLSRDLRQQPHAVE